MDRLGSVRTDRLGVAGSLVGVFLIVTALGTLVGQPWQTAVSMPVAAVQLVGVLLGVGIGTGLIWLVQQ